VRILLNGRPAEVEAVTLAEALARLGYDAGGAGVAVAVDGEVVPRGSWRSRALAGGERVEVLGATQGG